MTSGNSRSLVHQTVVIVLFAQLLCAALLCGAALLYEHHTRQRALDVRLQGRSDSLLGAIQDAEDPDDNVAIDPMELRLPGDDVYAVYNQGGKLLGLSPGAAPGLIKRSGSGFRHVRIDHTRYRVLEREAVRIIDRPENGGVGLKRPVTIIYASPESHLWHEVFEAVRFYLLAITVATGITVFLVSILLKRSLQPLNELAAATNQLSPPALVFKAPESVMRVCELQPLAEVLTDSVGRLRRAFAKEQHFLGDATHELKTAIAVVRSSVQLLMLRRRTPDEYAAGLERVLEDNNRVEGLVTQMLQLARVDEPSASNAPETDLHESAAMAIRQLCPVFEERGVPVSLVSSPPMMVRLQPERALALISNLVMNAVQHTLPDRPVVVSFRRPVTTEVVLEVSDTGSGIASEALPHIFERFYREDRSRSRDTGGAGLGLSICKSIVEAAGGTISIKSTLEEGTRVTVIFTAA